METQQPPTASSAIPPEGLAGARLREAVGPEYLGIRDQAEGAESPWPWVQALYADAVVVEKDGDDVVLGPPEEVVVSYVSVLGDDDAAPGGDQPAAVAITEAMGGAVTGTADAVQLRVCVIKAGVSGNGCNYPATLLREAAPAFDGAPVLVKSDHDHLASGGRDVRNIVGGLSGAMFIEGTTPDSGEIQAILTLANPTNDFATTLREAARQGLGHLYGLSIDAKGLSRPATIGGRAVKNVVAITSVNSVDLVAVPAAGGGVIGLLEAQRRQEDMNRTQLLGAIRTHRPALLAGKNPDTLTDAALTTLLTEALLHKQQR